MHKITAFAHSQTTNRVLYLVHLLPRMLDSGHTTRHTAPGTPPYYRETEFHVGAAHATDMRSANDIIRSS